MRRIRNKSVTMLVDSEFHKKIELERMKLEKILGTPLTNTKITSLIAMKGRLELPKIKRGFNIIDGKTFI